jgi:hypothetical protein
MRPRGTPTRLELHRLKHLQANRRGPLLTIHELSDEEKEILNVELMKDVRVQRLGSIHEKESTAIWDAAYLDVLSEFGVMCPHPIASIDDRGCDLCGCALFVRRNKKSVRARK